MKKTNTNPSIPSIPLPFQDKSFGFKIANNREILLNEDLEYDPFRPHRIRFYALLFIQKGEGVHYIDFKQYPYQSGSIIFISKEQVHAFEKNMEREASFLLFTEEFLEKGSVGSNLMEHLSLYNYHLYSPVIHLSPKQLEILSNLVYKIKEEYDAPDDFLTEELIHSALKIFLCIAERIRKKRRNALPNNKYHDDFLSFQHLLNQHIFKSRKVAFYANELHFSSKKLNRITQEIVGRPAKNYITDFLIIEIKRLLMNTSLSISEIGYQTGFEESTNFVKYFKKNTTMNPSEFRAQF